MSVSFHNQSIRFTLKNKSILRKWIESTASAEGFITGDIAYVFCTDEELLDINIRHLNHDTYTDIITFDYTEDALISGDIFISIDRVKENAAKFKTSFENELQRVMIHGVLHLCGYKDKTRAQSELMRSKENTALKRLARLMP
ncbi:MAG: rRNA maturation RNase YbeY [Bacteroidetes bacterium]|nr:rRNA maturation RNase YbeY [Bacteroidota bacterium]